MRVRWITLAQLVLLGCSGSHTLDDGGILFDSGPPPGDGGRPDAFEPLDGSFVDAGPRGSCDADRANAVVCGSVCDGPPTWHWNGDDCFWIDCGACSGEDCAAGHGSESACLGAHAACESTLCRSTGGSWLWWAEECGHYQCGFAPPQLCLVGSPVCDCGAFRSFAPGAGCFDDPSCPIPEPTTRDALCTATGGTWSPICCDTVCGEYCPEPCVSPACDCGPLRIFDEGRGCIESTSCHERVAGQTCEGQARCQEGTICCEHCGGAGCFGAPTCDYPTCGAGPDFDTCGNCLTCP